MITLFAGAGASKPLGFPVTSEFFTVHQGRRLRQEEVYKQVKNHLKKDVLDVEDTLRLLYPKAPRD